MLSMLGAHQKHSKLSNAREKKIKLSVRWQSLLHAWLAVAPARAHQSILRSLKSHLVNSVISSPVGAPDWQTWASVKQREPNNEGWKQERKPVPQFRFMNSKCLVINLRMI